MPGFTFGKNKGFDLKADYAKSCPLAIKLIHHRSNISIRIVSNGPYIDSVLNILKTEDICLRNIHVCDEHSKHTITCK
eukprot:m.27614 g.27614  ORF g.27614 m.27614 type:complete len:78 (-) comp7912_c0_seq1:31-264(-)